MLGEITGTKCLLTSSGYKDSSKLITEVLKRLAVALTNFGGGTS